ncbi:7TM diverse intracellular signaling domain-containing protein [Roseivirga sp. BDSF3-8]|uniref:7TM diverse intracellular signaling domain-containing protein n=1 Tax=Roseivirga sp. BDSF3-8 TaxID=3241598 RepID=UPI003531F664
MRYLSVIFYLLLSLFAASSCASPSSNEVERLNLAPFISYYPDSSVVVSLDEVTSGRLDSTFITLDKTSPAFGFADYPVWIRIDPAFYKKQVDDPVIQLEYALIQHVWFYTLSAEGEWQESHQGYEVVHGNSDRNQYYSIGLAKVHQTTPVYLKIRSSGSLRVPLFVSSASRINTNANNRSLVFGLYFGALLMMVLYNLFLYSALRDTNYIYYCLFITSNIIAQWVYSGYMHFEWPIFTSRLWQNHLSTSILITTLFATLFTIHFLNTSRFAKKMHKPLVILAWVCGVVGLLSPFLGYRLALLSMMFTVAIGPLLIWVASIITLRNKNKSARYYLGGWTVYLLCSTVVSLQAAQLLPEGTLADNFVRLGAVIEALLLSLALADRIQILRREKEEARARLIKNVRENEQNAQKQNQLLEQMVDERTRELQDKQEEVLTQAKVIEEQNVRLYKHSEELESLVKKRTRALAESNLELVKQNVRLEQYAYITSHNLRGPLANLMGVLNVFDRDDLSNPVNRDCIRHLDKATDNLEAVIKDLNKILNLKNDLSQVYETIELEPFISNLVDRTTTAFHQKEVNVYLELEEGLMMTTIPTYLYSILYNLISNSIKYRALDRPTKITIGTHSINGKLEIFVEDNGLGIDMDRFGDKLFGLYQRFHLHREGKGIGLHLVKTQTEILRGSITVDSKQGKGTRFSLVFDKSPELPCVDKEKRERQ